VRGRYPNFLAERDEPAPALSYVYDTTASLQQKHNYTGPVTSRAEVIQAVCGDKEQVFIQSVENDTVLQRLKNHTDSNPPLVNHTLPHPPNILIVFIDALSRAHFYRRLTSTAKALSEIQDSGKADVHQFFKYHAQASHTGPNTVPMYTGGVDMTYATSSIPFSFEKHPIWWHNFDPSQYVRAWVPGFCEDWPETYLNKPFPEGSMDHLMVMPFCHPDAFPLSNPYGPFNGPYSIRRRCIGDKRVHTYSIQYVKEFFFELSCGWKDSNVKLYGSS